MTQEKEAKQIQRLQAIYGGDWDCFYNSCQVAGLPVQGIPTPTPFDYVYQYCKRYNLDYVNEVCQIVLTEHPAILFLETADPLVAHCVFVDNLLKRWNQFDKPKRLVMYAMPGIQFIKMHKEAL